MRSEIVSKALSGDIARFFQEDDLSRNLSYISKLPDSLVDCSLKFKSDMVVAGLPYFFETFQFLLSEPISYSDFLVNEGRKVAKGTNSLSFQLPFSVALVGERIALNLLQRASSIATYTNEYVEKASKFGIEILDTRKTTPGLRALEKYAVQAGGGKNHRFGTVDTFMIKDNHKSFFGGLKEAKEFFDGLNSFYTQTVVEIHNIAELKEAISLGIKWIMLDNFSPDLIRDAIKLKEEGMSYEISGGITLDSIDNYLIKGVDAISVGSITYAAPPVDVSLKYEKNNG